jgi:uncharacterized delta-60 repeat protein
MRTAGLRSIPAFGLMAALLSTSASSAAANAAPAGGLDPTFGTRGVALVPTASTTKYVEARVAVASTGRIYVYSVRETLSRGFRLELTAFTASGHLDPAFNGGRPLSVHTDPLGDPECCSLGGPNPTLDGGVELSVGFFFAFSVRRYSATGRRIWQTGVSDFGRADVALAGGSVRGLAVDVLASGFHPVPLRLIGLTPSGQPDAAVGAGGKRTLSLLSGPFALVADPLNRLYAVGNAYASPLSTPPSGRSIVVTRLSSSGVVDTTYGTSGKTEIPVPDTDHSPGAVGFNAAGTVALAADGSLFLAGSAASQVTGRQVVAVRRVDPTGALDTGFGNGGMLEIAGSSGSTRFGSIAVDANGRLVASYVDRLSPLQPTLARFNPTTGALDPSFGHGGTLAVAGYVMDLALTATGKLITVSRVARNGQFVLYLARRSL